MEERHRRITKIPFPGGSGSVPTGAIQFENDWPGLFLRGDTAVPLMANIRALSQALKGTSLANDVRVFPALAKLEQLADMIEKDVSVAGDP